MALTQSEKRTIRYASVGIAIYLALFGGWKVWGWLSQKRTEYNQLIAQGQKLKTEVQPFADQSTVVKKLMDDFHFDPAMLTTNTLVADATAAIQKAAMSGGLQPGPVRESAGRSANKALATIQFEGAGQVASVMAFLQRLPTLGFPLLVDSVQISSDPMRPGQMKLTITVIVLDFDQWKNQEASHA